MRPGFVARIGSGFNPLTLNPVAWYKPETLSALSNGDPVGTWPDSSGNGRDLTQGTAAAKPTYRTGLQNGRPGVRFDGVDDVLRSASFTLAQAIHVFAVMRLQTTPVAQRIFLDGFDNSHRMVLDTSATSHIEAYSGTFLTGGVVTFTVAHQITALFNGASSSLTVDGGTATTGNAGTQGGGGVVLGSATGGQAPADVEWLELLIFAGAQTVALLRNYILGRWGTP